MTDTEQLTYKTQLRGAFRPSSPIEKHRLFAGRIKQVDDVIGAVLQPGQHAILYGERGVGKTSLAKVLTEIVSGAGIKIVNSDTINCDATDDFSSLWHKAFRELTFKIKNVAGFGGDVETELPLDQMVQEMVTPDDVRRVLSTLRNRNVIAFDEFDRVQDKTTRTLMADTIKNLSDHNSDTTLLIVGVAQSVDSLITEHRSVERCLVQVLMPRMSYDELVLVIDKGMAETGMTMSPTVKDKIVRLSHGLPHYTHLLSLETGLAAIERKSTEISDADFVSALHGIVKSKHTVTEAYFRAVSSSHRNNNYKMMILGCALSPTDAQGFFQAPDMVETIKIIYGKEFKVSDVQRYLNDFMSGKRGNILQRQGGVRSYRYRFCNPLLQPFTIIHSLADKMITESQLWMMDTGFMGNKN